MAINLSSIRPASGEKKNKKRVGRGNASGHGTYATRGLKGQKSRSGASGLKRIGMKSMLRSTPKLRGFKSLKPKAQAVSIGSINRHFADGASITPSALFKAGVISDASIPAKILGGGSLARKALKVSGIGVTESAKRMIESQGGTCA